MREYREYKITYENFRGQTARTIVHARSPEEAAEDFQRSHPRIQEIVSVEELG